MQILFVKLQLIVIFFCVAGQKCPYDSITQGCIDVPINQSLPRSMGLDVEIIDNTLYSYMVSFQERLENQECYQHFCGGTMIAPNLVLTAAHCMDDIKQNQPLRNSSDLLIYKPRGDKYFVAISPRCRHLANETYGRMIIEEIYMHPDYRKRHGVLHNDVAIAKLVVNKERFYEGPLVQLVDQNVQISKIQKPLKTMGYGQAKEQPDPNNTLYTVFPLHGGQLNYLDYEICKALLTDRGDELSAHELDYNIMVCFYNPLAATCNGDSGGPLLDGDVQIGIVSWGPGASCQAVNAPQAPSVFVRLPEYVAWIQNIVITYGCYKPKLCQQIEDDEYNDIAPPNAPFDCKKYYDLHLCPYLDEEYCKNWCGKYDECSSAKAIQCDVDALLAFKKSVTKGGSIFASWKGTNPCTWDFIECVKVDGINQRVVQFHLLGLLEQPCTSDSDICIDWEVEGTVIKTDANYILNPKYYEVSALLVPEFSKMRFLTHFLISQNNITGQLLDEYSVLEQLQLLMVDANLTGTLPSSYSKWTGIYQFESSSNNIFGSIPKEYSRWKNLDQLIVTSNKLSGTLAQEFSMWTKLSGLYVGDNQFSGILPPTYSTWANVTTLQFFGNTFYGTFPPEYSTLASIDSLNADTNQFSGTLPSQYSTWKNCVYLNCQDCLLSGIVPPEYSTMIALDSILFRNNKLSGILPAEYSTMETLHHIVLNLNKLSGTLPPEYSMTRTLNNLALEQNRLSGILPPEYSKIKTLENLRLQENKFSGTLPTEYSALEFCNRFQIYGNKITGSLPPQYSTLSKIEYFYVSRNDLTGSLPAQYSTMVFLKDFQSFWNNIDSVVPDEWSVFGPFTIIEV